MAFVGKIARAATGVLGDVLFGGGGKRPDPQVIAPRPPTRNEAADAARSNDALRRRRGAGANEITGSGGAEAMTPGGRTLLGPGG